LAYIVVRALLIDAGLLAEYPGVVDQRRDRAR
jgi:hypothetical protein